KGRPRQRCPHRAGAPERRCTRIPPVARATSFFYDRGLAVYREICTVVVRGCSRKVPRPHSHQESPKSRKGREKWCPGNMRFRRGDPEKNRERCKKKPTRPKASGCENYSKSELTAA